VSIVVVLLIVVLVLLLAGSLIGLAFSLLWLALTGLVIGALGRLVLPGRQEISLVATALVGTNGLRIAPPSQIEGDLRMRRLIIVLAAAVSLMAVGAGPAAADPANKNTLHFTLTCPNRSVDAVFELSSSDSFHIVQFSSNFLWKSLDYVTPTGESGRIERGIEGGGHSDLVTCTYTGAVSGNHYTVTGFFTP
jgi:hypothetical protein